MVLVTGEFSEIYLTLKPVYYSSIPDEMAWLEGGAEQRIIPMRTRSGTHRCSAAESGRWSTST